MSGIPRGQPRVLFLSSSPGSDVQLDVEHRYEGGRVGFHVSGDSIMAWPRGTNQLCMLPGVRTEALEKRGFDEPASRTSPLIWLVGSLRDGDGLT
jgi:hypothetical protein